MKCDETKEDEMKREECAWCVYENWKDENNSSSKLMDNIYIDLMESRLDIDSLTIEQ